MPLDAADKARIRTLARSDIADTTAGLRRFVKKAMWLGKTNRYARNVIERLRADHPLNPKRRRHLAQYIAASAVLHASDSWGYLGRSVACLLAGDAHRALHLAYYSELRAALSLLAGAGVGIFNHRHFTVTGVNTTARLRSKSGTHQIAWDALEYWSNQPASGSLFASLVRPGGRSLDDWFQPLGGSTTLAAQARIWFMQWGMDLKFARRDRDARNESSYRPDGIPTSWIISPSDTLDYVHDLWATLEPSASSSFEGIDRSILRLALEAHFKGTMGGTASPTNPRFVAMVNRAIGAQGLAPRSQDLWRSFLTRASVSVEPKVFSNSALRPGNPLTDHFAIISRAVLLLRVATGSAFGLLNAAALDAAQLQFWWRSVGEARGLWNPALPPVMPVDLWADVNDVLSDVATFSASSPPALHSVNGIASELGDRFNVLCSHERVGLWGLCPA